MIEPLPLITAAMPVYNAGRYLRPAVISIVKQTFTNWELLIIDDGSTDNALRDIADIADPRIRILRDGANRGLAARLNEAIDLARGRYFARMDQDDVSYPGRFARQIEALQNDPGLDLVAVRAITIDEFDQAKGLFPYALSHDEICARPWRGFYFPHPSWMGRIDWFRKYRYSVPGPYFCEDQDLLLRSFSKSIFGIVPEVLFAYRIPGKNKTSKQFGTRWSLLNVQLRYFHGKREWISGLRAISVFAARILLDTYKMFCRLIGFYGRQAATTEWAVLRSDWQTVHASVDDRPKKICFLATVPFSIHVFLSSHIAELRKDYEVVVATNCSAGSEIKFKMDGVRIVHIPFARKPAPIADVRCLIKLVKFFHRERFSSVHSISPKSGFLSMIAARLAGVPVRIHTFTGQVWATRKGFSRWVLKTMDRFFAAQATQLLVDSVSQREFLLREKVIQAKNSTVLADGSMCGVDTKRFAPDPQARKTMRAALNISDKDVLFLFLGRLNRDKGILTLAEAFKKVSRDWKNIHLLLVGPDEENFQNHPLFQGLENVTFVGYTAEPEHYMNAADVFCLPSRREGFGAAILEAASVGVPAVASRIYGITDAIVENETGFLHSPDDSHELAEAMISMLCDPEMRKRLGTLAHKRAIEIFPKERLTAALAGLYKELVS